MKITAAQREFRRYTGISADYERRGLGSSRFDLCLARRFPPAPDPDPVRPGAQGKARDNPGQGR